MPDSFKFNTPLPFVTSEDKLRMLELIWEHSPIGLAIVDSSGYWKEVNPAFCHILGYSRYELINGMTYKEVTHKDDVYADLLESSSLAAGNTDYVTYQMDKRYLHKIGKIIYVTLKVVRFDKPDHSFEYFISMAIQRDLIQERVVSLDDVIKVVEDVSSKNIIKILNHKLKRKHFLKVLGEYMRNNWTWISPIVIGLGWLIQYVIQKLL